MVVKKYPLSFCIPIFIWIMLPAVIFFSNGEEITYSIPETGYLQYQKASWYNYDLDEAPNYSLTHDTAASRDYPRGTMLRVCWHPKCVIVRVNDYGPNAGVHPDRTLDLSSHAFAQLVPLSRGVIGVTIEPVTVEK